MPAIVLPRRAEGESRSDELGRRSRRVALAGGSGECRTYARGVAAGGARAARRSASRGVESLHDPGVCGRGDGKHVPAQPRSSSKRAADRHPAPTRPARPRYLDPLAAGHRRRRVHRERPRSPPADDPGEHAVPRYTGRAATLLLAHGGIPAADCHVRLVVRSVCRRRSRQPARARARASPRSATRPAPTATHRPRRRPSPLARSGRSHRP
jgi:hypothetical protein